MCTTDRCAAGRYTISRYTEGRYTTGPVFGRAAEHIHLLIFRLISDHHSHIALAVNLIETCYIMQLAVCRRLPIRADAKALLIFISVPNSVFSPIAVLPIFGIFLRSRWFEGRTVWIQFVAKYSRAVLQHTCRQTFSFYQQKFCLLCIGSNHWISLPKRFLPNAHRMYAEHSIYRLSSQFTLFFSSLGSLSTVLIKSISPVPWSILFSKPAPDYTSTGF